MPVVATITILHYVDRRSTGCHNSLETPREAATRAPRDGTADTVDGAQAIPPAGNCAITAPAIASPTALPIVHPPPVQPIPLPADPFRYSQVSKDVILTDSIETTAQPKGSLFTESPSGGQVLFYTRLQLSTKMTPNLWPWLWCSGQHHPPEQVLEALTPQSWWLQVPQTKFPLPYFPHLDVTWWFPKALPRPLHCQGTTHHKA